jgi:hypothetical protein
LLKTALTKRQPGLVTVTFAVLPLTEDFTVSFTFDRTEASRGTIQPADRSGITGYQKRRRVSKNTGLSVYEYWADELQSLVLISSYGPLSDVE